MSETAGQRLVREWWDWLRTSSVEDDDLGELAARIDALVEDVQRGAAAEYALRAGAHVHAFTRSSSAAVGHDTPSPDARCGCGMSYAEATDAAGGEAVRPE